MATRSRTTFQKRLKEMKRMEKQRAKAARREEKRLAKRAEKAGGEAPAGPEFDIEVFEPAETAEPADPEPQL